MTGDQLVVADVAEDRGWSADAAALEVGERSGGHVAPQRPDEPLPWLIDPPPHSPGKLGRYQSYEHGRGGVGQHTVGYAYLVPSARS